MTTREMLLSAGVRNLKEFGYPDVSTTNILTDEIYSRFFAKMLEENRGRGVDLTITELLSEIEGDEA